MSFIGVMKKRLLRIGPLKAGLILGVLYALLGLLFVPFLIFGAVIGKASGGGGAGISVLFAVLIPLFYGVAGFIGGVISAALYNFIVKFTGGLEVEVEDLPASTMVTA